MVWNTSLDLDLKVGRWTEWDKFLIKFCMPTVYIGRTKEGIFVS